VIYSLVGGLVYIMEEILVAAKVFRTTGEHLQVWSLQKGAAKGDTR